MKETKMAKKLKTTNKPDSPIKDDGRESMFRGAYKDDVYKDDPEKQEEVGTVEATQQEPEGFMDANNASAVNAAEPIANPLPVAAVVLPIESNPSVIFLVSGPSPLISEIPPALSATGP